MWELTGVEHTPAFAVVIKGERRSAADIDSRPRMKVQRIEEFGVPAGGTAERRHPQFVQMRVVDEKVETRGHQTALDGTLINEPTGVAKRPQRLSYVGTQKHRRITWHGRAGAFVRHDVGGFNGGQFVGSSCVPRVPVDKVSSVKAIWDDAFKRTAETQSSRSDDGAAAWVESGRAPEGASASTTL